MSLKFDGHTATLKLIRVTLCGASKMKVFPCAAPAAFLLYSQRANISRMLLDTGPAPIPDMLLPIAGIRGVRAIDYDPVDNTVYWIESRSNMKAIRKARENSTNVSRLLKFRCGVSSLSGRQQTVS